MALIQGDLNWEEFKELRKAVRYYMEGVEKGVRKKFEDAQKILKEQVLKVKNGEVGFYNTAFNIVRDQLFFAEIFRQKND